MKRPQIQEKSIHQLFEFSVFLKGLHAIIEIVGGILLYSISTSYIISTLENLAESELLNDPHDVVSNYLLHVSETFTGSGQSFAAYYLLSHGIIKMCLVVGLLRNKLWSYPASLVALGAFIIYQVYRYTFTHSIWLIVLTIFDFLVIWLIWHEYKLVLRSKTFAK